MNGNPNRVRPHGPRRGRGRGRRGSWHIHTPQGEDHRTHAQLDPAPPVPHGTCMAMCPARELEERQAQNRLHLFEMLTGSERARHPRADPARTVKEYSRPAAGKDSTRPSDLRPPAVLLETVNFLIDEIAASTTLEPWTEVYSFVFDRLRSVRQDMTIQRVAGSEAVAVLERTVRFLLYSSYRLCGAPLRHFDPCINNTHLQESLSLLLRCYGTAQHHQQGELEALCLLYNLGSPHAMQRAIGLPEHVRSSPAVRLALAISRAFVEQNPVRLFRLAQRLDFLQACALHRHLQACRAALLMLYSHAFSSRNSRYPLEHLAQLLGLQGAEATRLCHAHGVQVSGQWVLFSKTSFVATPTHSALPSCADLHSLEESKRGGTALGDIIHGQS